MCTIEDGVFLGLIRFFSIHFLTLALVVIEVRVGATVVAIRTAIVAAIGMAVVARIVAVATIEDGILFSLVRFHSIHTLLTLGLVIIEVRIAAVAVAVGTAIAMVARVIATVVAVATIEDGILLGLI